MTEQPRIASDPWAYDDAMRRGIGKLFTETEDSALNSRRYGYRVGLLAVIGGLAEEDIQLVASGVRSIEAEFRKLDTAPVPKADDKSFDVVTDP